MTPQINAASTAGSTTTASHTESVAAVPRVEQNKNDMGVFFGIGIVVNLTMFTALLIWGYNQWKKNNVDKK